MSDTDSAPLQETLADLQTILRQADYSTVLKDYSLRLADQHAEMFSGQHDADGAIWAALSPRTTKCKHGNRVLVATGALMQSLVHVGGDGNISEASARELLFGTTIGYAIFHENGTAKLPARPPVGISQAGLDRLCAELADATIEMMRA